MTRDGTIITDVVVGKRGMVNMRTARGFTLIELMIVVAVVAILAAIAYPSYQEQIRKSRRAQAKADLVELAQVLERRFTVNNSYAGALPFDISPREASGAAVRYNITPNPVPAGAVFTLTATPAGAQASDTCGALSLTQAGVKAATGGTVEQCW